MRTGPIDVVKGNFVGLREVADIYYVDIASRIGANVARAFLSDKGESLCAAGVLVPPDVVSLTTERRQRAQRDRIRWCSASAPTADVPDLDPIIPERGEQNPIAHESVMHVRRTHHLR